MQQGKKSLKPNVEPLLYLSMSWMKELENPQLQLFNTFLSLFYVPVVQLN